MMILQLLIINISFIKLTEFEIKENFDNTKF